MTQAQKKLLIAFGIGLLGYLPMQAQSPDPSAPALTRDAAAYQYKVQKGFDYFDGMSGTVTYQYSLPDMDTRTGYDLESLLYDPMVMGVQNDPKNGTCRIVINRVDVSKAQLWEVVDAHLQQKAKSSQ